MRKTIVMIHGMWVAGGCWELWREFYQRRGYTCLAPTLRHHDGEPVAVADPDLGCTSLLDYAQHLESFIWDLAEVIALRAWPAHVGACFRGVRVGLIPLYPGELFR
jgi:hypothetical protein